MFPHSGLAVPVPRCRGRGPGPWQGAGHVWRLALAAPTAAAPVPARLGTPDGHGATAQRPSRVSIPQARRGRHPAQHRLHPPHTHMAGLGPWSTPPVPAPGKPSKTILLWGVGAARALASLLTIWMWV